MKSGRRVKVKRSHLQRACLDDQRDRVPKGGDCPCHGKVVGGNATDGWEVDVDAFLATNKTMTIKGNMLTIVNADEDNVVPLAAPDVETFTHSERMSEDEAETVADFLDLSQDELKAATSATCRGRSRSWRRLGHRRGPSAPTGMTSTPRPSRSPTARTRRASTLTRPCTRTFWTRRSSTSRAPPRSWANASATRGHANARPASKLCRKPRSTCSTTPTTRIPTTG